MTDHDDTKVVKLTTPNRKQRTADRAPDAPVRLGDLTAKQEAFAQLVGHEGLSLSQAYREAYDASGMADTSIWTAASELAKHPVVSVRIEELKRRKAEEIHRDRGLAIRVITDELLVLMKTATREADRIRAIELFGKLGHVRAFEEVEQRPKLDADNMTSEEIGEEIVRRLAALAAKD